MMHFENIAPLQLSELLRKEPVVLLLDVREPFELTAFGVIPGVINIPMSELMGRLDELPEDKTRPVVVICQSGTRSRDVAGFLSRKGFGRVFNLSGGTSGWLAAGLPSGRAHA
jgi:rhodanese-related sulfurtransferase